MSNHSLALKIIYELTISERYFRSDGYDFSSYFFRAMHNISSMALSERADDDIIEYLRGFFENFVSEEAIKEKDYFIFFLSQLNIRN